MACFIFDFDGTLVDSEPLHRRAAEEVVRALGGSFSEEAYAKGLGRGSRAVLQALLEEAGIELSEEELWELVERKEQLFLQMAQRELREVEGATPFLRELKERGHRVGIATGYFRDKIEALAHRLPFLSYVDVITTTEGLRPKPHPDVYEKAKEALGCEGGFAFEDAPAGIQSALGAGLTAFGMATTLPKACLYATFPQIRAFSHFHEARGYFREKGLL